jgi:hypothetical protein
MISVVSDVHFVPEVVTALATTGQNGITAGMSEDDVKKILGNPSSIKTDNDQLIYIYDTGPYSEIDFRKDATGSFKVSAFNSRAPQDQIVEGKTKVADAIKILGGDTSLLLDTVDGGKLWPKAPLMNADLLFGSDGVLKKRNYTQALTVLVGKKGSKVADVQTSALGAALNDATKTKITAEFSEAIAKTAGTATKFQIVSPDVANQFIELTCSDACNKSNVTITDVALKK